MTLQNASNHNEAPVEPNVNLALVKPMATRLWAPPINRTMLQSGLDRSFFRQIVPLLAVCIAPSYIGELQRSFRSRLLDTPMVRKIHPLGDQKLVLCRPGFDNKHDEDFQRFLKEKSAQVVPFELKLDYDYWQAGKIRSQILCM